MVEARQRVLEVVLVEHLAPADQIAVDDENVDQTPLSYETVIGSARRDVRDHDATLGHPMDAFDVDATVGHAVVCDAQVGQEIPRTDSFDRAVVDVHEII